MSELHEEVAKLYWDEEEYCSIYSIMGDGEMQDAPVQQFGTLEPLKGATRRRGILWCSKRPQFGGLINPHTIRREGEQIRVEFTDAYRVEDKGQRIWEAKYNEM